MSDRAGRNDPCPCGSGKKYKLLLPGQGASEAAVHKGQACDAYAGDPSQAGGACLDERRIDARTATTAPR